METKELKIQTPEGYEIDKENSTFEKIVFKKKETNLWRFDETKKVYGYVINSAFSKIMSIDGALNNADAHCVFATEKQAKSALAMAQISQIMSNDEIFGGMVTDEEWGDAKIHKYCIYRVSEKIAWSKSLAYYYFLAFHTSEQRDLFLKENGDLVKQYLMID